MKKRKNLFAFALTLIISVSLVSCGGDDKEGGGNNTTTPTVNTPTVNTGTLAQEGAFTAATSVDDFKNKISQGAFAKANFQQVNNYPYNTVQTVGVEYLLYKCTYNNNTNSWGIFTWTNSSTDCDSFNPLRRKEYSDSRVESDFGNSKAQIQTNLINLINGGSNQQLSAGGYALNVLKDGYYHTIDFRAPLVANPVSKVKIENNVYTEMTKYSAWRAIQ